MAETVNGGGGPGGPPKDKLSMEIRLLLAFLLMGAVMFLTPYLIKTPPQPVANKTAQSAQPAPAPSAAEPAAETASPAVEQVHGGDLAAASSATPQQTLPPLIIDNDLFRVALSNQGATVRSWVLKKYKGNDNKPLDLVNTTAGMEYPFSLYIPGQEAVAKAINWAFYEESVDPDGLGVTFTYSDRHVGVRKVFRFQKNSYISEVSTAVTVDGKPVPNLIEWRGGFGDLTISNVAANLRVAYFNVPDNKLVEQKSGVAKNGPVSSAGQYSFAGLADAYFAAVFLPRGNNSMQETTFSDWAHSAFDQNKALLTGIAVSDGAENRFELFVGPKDLDQLRRINPKLEQLVDFGWFSFLAKPLFLITNWLNDAFVHNFGWAIVVVTVVLNMILFPVKLSNMKSMRKMQALKPQIDAISQKYKNISLRDPRKAEQNQEVMDLYKKNGVNPMGGCFPMLLQIPFFIAFYKVFMVSVEMRGASWLWVGDLSQPEQIPIRILPVVMVASQFVMQKMTPQPTGDPSQQKMMMFMPLIFGFMFYNFPSGLVLYYLTSNLVSMGQQWFFNHTGVANQAALSVEPPKKKNVRK
jgi:YidC/Oxa1 family membrane protein insertase